MNEAINIDQLAESIAKKMATSVPLELRLWNAAECAEYLRVAPRQFKERTSQIHTFPPAVRLPSDNGLGHPKWYAQEVIDWAKKYRGQFS